MPDAAPDPVPDAAPDPVQAARVLRRYHHDARSRRSDGATGWGRRLGHWYLVLLSTAVVGPLVAAAVVHLAQAAGCAAPAPCLDDAQRPVLAAALTVLLVGLLGVGARALGPLGATAAEATWLLSTPAARGRLLLPALLRGLVVAAALGAAAGTAVGLLALGPLAVAAPGATGPAPPTSALAVVAPVSALAPAATTGAALAVLVVSGLVLVQVHGTTAAGPRRLGRAVTLAGAAAVAAVVLLPTLGTPPTLPTWVPSSAAPAWAGPVWAGPVWAGPPPGVLLPAAVAGAAALLVALVAARQLDRTPVRVLLAPGSRHRGVVGAVLRLDTDVLGAPTAGPGHRAGPRLRLPRTGGVWTALVVVGTLAVTSRPERVLDAVVLLVLPLVAAALLGTPAGLGVATAVATIMTARVAAPARSLTRSASLQRSLPVDLRAARAALLVAPGVAVLAWALTAAALTGAPVLHGTAVALAALAGAVRAATPAPGDAGALLMTEAGPVALGTATDPLRGADAAALAVLPLLLGAPTWLAVAAPGLVLLQLLRSGPR